MQAKEIALLSCLVCICLAFSAVLSPVSFRFDVIYACNRWASGYSSSGRGSTLEHTKVIRTALVNLLPKFSSFIDAPCGDFHWMKSVRSLVPDFDSKYLGIDRVQTLIQQNTSLFPTLQFRVGDVEMMNDNAELVLMRDLLQHLKTDTQIAILRTLKRNGSKLLLINYNPILVANVLVRIDPAPDWCEINLEKSPFGMKPIYTYKSDGLDKHYGLFQIKDITA